MYSGIDKLIPNEQLRPSDIPDGNADWVAMSLFALTFDGYADYPANWALFAATRAAIGESSAKLNSLNLTELRACLFHEQRLHKWSLDNPDYELDLSFMRALVDSIRVKVGSRSCN